MITPVSSLNVAVAAPVRRQAPAAQQPAASVPAAPRFGFDPILGSALVIGGGFASAIALIRKAVNSKPLPQQSIERKQAVEKPVIKIDAEGNKTETYPLTEFVQSTAGKPRTLIMANDPSDIYPQAPVASVEKQVSRVQSLISKVKSLK